MNSRACCGRAARSSWSITSAPKKGPRRAFEQGFAPLARRLGWRPEFRFGRLAQWAERHGGVRVMEHRPMPPLGHFSLIRFRRDEAAMGKRASRRPQDFWPPTSATLPEFNSLAAAAWDGLACAVFYECSHSVARKRLLVGFVAAIPARGPYLSPPLRPLLIPFAWGCIGSGCGRLRGSGARGWLGRVRCLRKAGTAYGSDHRACCKKHHDKLAVHV